MESQQTVLTRARTVDVAESQLARGGIGVRGFAYITYSVTGRGCIPGIIFRSHAECDVMCSIVEGAQGGDWGDIGGF